MLTPRKVKHRKHHRGRLRGAAQRMNTVAFGQYGLMATESSWLTARQIESARRAMTRFVARGGKIWIRIFPDKPITVKGNEIRMGGGKGAVDHFVSVVKKGTVLFEMDGVPEATAKSAMRLASYKLPVKSRFVTRTV